MELRRIPTIDDTGHLTPEGRALCDWAESPQANFDGVAVKPYKFAHCPYCDAPSIIVHTHNGGYPDHHGWRCKANRKHQGPLVPWVPELRAGKYEHIGRYYRAIVELVLEEAVA